MLIFAGVVIVGMFGIAGTFLSIEAKRRNDGRAKPSPTAGDRQASSQVGSNASGASCRRCG